MHPLVAVVAQLLVRLLKQFLAKMIIVLSVSNLMKALRS